MRACAFACAQHAYEGERERERLNVFADHVNSCSVSSIVLVIFCRAWKDALESPVNRASKVTR